MATPVAVGVLGWSMVACQPGAVDGGDGNECGRGTVEKDGVCVASDLLDAGSDGTSDNTDSSSDPDPEDAATTDTTGSDKSRDSGDPGEVGTDTDLADAGDASGEDTSRDPDPEEYRTIVVPANDQKLVQLSSDDTFENVLVDVTAQGADFRIIASGNGWAIRDVGIKGSYDVGNDTGGYSNVISARGEGVIENVYLGDGHDDGIRKGALGVPARHSEHIDVVNTYIARWTGNAVYAAGPARTRPPGKTDGGGGSLAFIDSYFRDNNIAHLRIASDGTEVVGTVIHNTGNVPPHPNSSGGSGVVNSRGLYTGYGDPSQVVTVRDSDIRLTEDNTNGAASAVVSGTHDHWGELSTVRVVDSEVEGAMLGDHVEVGDNVGNNPDIRVPAGVPTSPEEAAAGL